MQCPSGQVLTEQFCYMTNAELIRTGGQKAVYKATIQGQTVAVKLIELDTGQGEDFEKRYEEKVVIERAKREVSIIKQVDVPVLARSGPLDLTKEKINDSTWLLFTEEWIEGQNLRDMIGKRGLPHTQVAQLGVDLVQAVCWLNSKGMVHRDIKPENVMWASDRSRFVLVDPGIAFDLHGASLTLAGMTVGTTAYLSPEQIDPMRKRDLNFRSDLFAVGVVMYEASLSEHPFMKLGTTANEVVAGILHRRPDPLVERIEGFPEGLSTLIARLLGKEPHQRYRTCQRALQEFETIAKELRQ